jgi:hypothetical protein
MSTIFRIYVFILIAVSIIFDLQLLKKIYAGIDELMPYVLAVAIAFLLLFSISIIFGEREHLMLILTMPYFLLAVMRLRGVDCAIIWVIIIGVLAGIGFSIKPHFLLTLMILEVYLMFNKKNFFTWCRLETIITGIVIILYAGSIFIFAREYIYKVLPLVMNLYFTSVQFSWVQVATSVWMQFFVISLGCFILFKHKVMHKELSNIFMLAAIGFVGAYLLQHTPWFYHAFPFIFFCALVLVQLIVAMLRQPDKSNMLLAILMMLSLFIFTCVVPTIFFTINFNYERDYKFTDFVNFINNHAYNKKLYSFSSAFDVPYRMIDKLTVTSVSRFPSQLLIPGLVRKLKYSNNRIALEKYNNYKKEVFNMVIDDLRSGQPSLIIVDVAEYQALFFGPFNYLKFFSQDKRFRKIFSKYKFIKKIGSFEFYRRVKQE